MISQVRKADSSAVESRGQVLFVHISPGSPPSFIRRDLEILRSKFQVTPFFFRGHTDIPRLIPRIARHDVILSWFAWDNAFWSNRIASVLHRGTVTIAGGFDVVNMPEIGYGNLLHSGPRLRTRDALRTAKTVLAVWSGRHQSSLPWLRCEPICATHCQAGPGYDRWRGE